jgi:hypothetical protein
VITKEEVDPPGLEAPRKGEAASPPIPQEDPPTAPSPTEPLSQSNAPKPPKEEPPKGVVKVQKPVYFVSTVLHDARERYTMQEKLLYTLLIASGKLRHYFQDHPIKVVTD